MVSRTSKTESVDSWPGRRLSHPEFGRDLLRRREAAGNPTLPRNSGKRRTPSKRALLKAIEEAGGEW
jgi:hypothetical protein